MLVALFADKLLSLIKYNTNKPAFQLPIFPRTIEGQLSLQSSVSSILNCLCLPKWEAQHAGLLHAFQIFGQAQKKFLRRQE
jgi:hypothetical protein